jgi:cell wall-associated NlpC family hydrolase
LQNSGISSLATTSPSPPAAGSSHSRFSLTGRSVAVDRRIDAVRRDLADIRLASRVFAPHYAACVARSALAISPIRRDRASDSQILSEILPGECFDLLELSNGSAWGVCAADGSVGFVSAAALGVAAAPTHVVAIVSASVRADPDAEGAIVGTLPMGASVANRGGGDFLAVPGGFVAVADLRPIDSFAPDFVAVADTLVGVANKPGGRSGAGLDAGGLVFLALAMAGIPAPRFGDLQAGLGRAIEGEALIRGDLVFFAEHAAILTDGDTVVHVAADGVRLASLADVVASGAFGPVVAKRRLA